MPLTEAEELELLELEALQAQQPVVQTISKAPQPKIEVPASQVIGEMIGNQAEQSGITLGRTARNALTGLSSLADIGLLVPKTAALAGGMLAQNLGAKKVGQGLIDIGMTPTMAETTQTMIDDATGGVLKPRGNIDKVGDFVAQGIASAVPFTATAQIPTNTSGGMLQSLKSVLSPDDAIQGMTKKTPSSTPLTSEDVRVFANQAYKEAERLGGIIKPNNVDEFIDDIESKVKIKDVVAQKLKGADPAAEAISVMNENMRGQPMTLERFQAIDEALTDLIDNHVELGRLKKSGLGLTKIQDNFRNFVENLDENAVEGGKEGFEALKQGRKLWSQSAKMRDIERIISRAEMSEQPSNAIKSGFKTLYNNPDRMRGFTQEQKDLIKSLSDEGIALEALRGVASRLFGIGSAVSGGATGFVLGKGAEMGARGIREAAMMNRAQGVLNDISGYSPAYNPMFSVPTAAGVFGAGSTQTQQMLSPPMRQLPTPNNSMLMIDNLNRVR